MVIADLQDLQEAQLSQRDIVLCRLISRLSTAAQLCEKSHFNRLAMGE